MFPRLSLRAAGLAIIIAAPAYAAVQIVDRPETNRTNRFYVSNRAPLAPSRFISLPVGSVMPRGWLREMLRRQREGLTGHLGEISAWLQKENSAWLSMDGKGDYGWEELPYWLKGYIELAYIFEDPKMIGESHAWIKGVLASQRPDGDFGPDQRFEDGTRDYWANMIMLFCLESYYDHSRDPAVLELMAKYFKHQLSVPDNRLLTHYWQHMRGGDNLYSIYWLYNRTGDPELLKTAEKIHRCTANWRMKENLPDWHNVNIAECFREPAEFYLQSRAEADLGAAYANFFEVRKRYGQVPGGMFGGDENCRPGYTDPRQAIETCGIVEQMLSDEMLVQISGDPFWADHCENVAFNTYPAAIMPDFTALRYLTAPNLAVSDSKNHAPGIQNGGPFLMMNPFSSRCCQHNHSHGWPYFNKSLWMATPDNGVCAALYTACEARVKVGDGAEVQFTEDTRYPFEETVRFTVTAKKPVSFPLYLRIPEWCGSAAISVDGAVSKVQPRSGKFVRIEREWTSGDTVALQLPMKLSVQQWTNNQNSVSVNYGPLTFSLRIGERYERHDSIRTAISDSKWQKGADTSKWPSYEILPTTPWNYGLVVDQENPSASFALQRRRWPSNDFPFTTEGAPITLSARARRIPEWDLDRFGLCAVLQNSPVLSEEAIETVSLVPMGAARLRISSFPALGTGSNAHRWTPPPKPKPSPYIITTSHCFSGDTVDALADRLEPASSNDQSIPRFTWWDHRGTTEWVQYELPSAKTISSIEVYWFDDTGSGQCRIPGSWRLLYLDGEQLKAVPGSMPRPTRNQWNRVSFSSITTSALRIEVDLQPGFSGGILEWRLHQD
jgi:hypothetical protein